MSCLRRRAIVVSRARSPGRSSIGGRVSARATAGESSGSASARSQAIASRTSGRWKRAAGPERWKGMPRSSIAAATVPPWLAGSATRTQISCGSAPVASRCSTSRATAWDWARSFEHFQNLTAGSRKRCSRSTTSPSGWRSRNQAAGACAWAIGGSCGRARASVSDPPMAPSRRPCSGPCPRARRGGSGCRWRGRSGGRVELGLPPPARRPSGTRSGRRFLGGRRGVRRRGSRGRGRRRRWSRLPAPARMRSWAV